MTGFLALGSNLGNREMYLLQAITHISRKIGVITSISSLYETKADGFESENMFLNMVICIETRLTPQQILEATQKIEKEIGRKNKSLFGYSDRIIDIDLILCDNLIIDTKELTIPHPRFHERFFVLEPLNEIAPDLIHPTMGKTVGELLISLK